MEPSKLCQDIGSKDELPVPGDTNHASEQKNPASKLHSVINESKVVESICDILGIKFTSKAEFLRTLGNVSPENFTNQAVCEIWMQVFKTNQKKNTLNVSWVEIKEAIASMYSVNLSSMPNSYIRKAFEDVKNERRYLLPRKHLSVFKDFMSKQWKLPATKVYQKKASSDKKCGPVKNSVEDSLRVTEVESFTSQSETKALSKLGKEYNLLVKAYATLEIENKQLKAKNNNLKEENATLRKKITAWNPKRTNQALKRKQQSISSWVTKYRMLKCNYQNEVNEKIKDLRGSLQKVKGAAKKKVKRLKAKQQSQTITQDQLTQNLAKELQQARIQEEHCRKDINFWQNEAVEAQERLDDKVQDLLPTKLDGKSYTHEIREASYFLQDVGVSQKNVSKALKAVVKSITGKELCGPLPSYGTQNTFTKEMKSLSRQQIASLVKESKNLTLKYDGTTKKVGHLVETEIEADGRTFLIGMKQQNGGTADEYVNSIKQSLNAIESESGTGNAKVGTRIVNTMTDRCKTNDAVDKKLEDQLGQKLNSFRCAMHPLDGMAKQCEKVVKSFEEEMKVHEKKKTEKYPFQHRAESNTQATVRCASKLFYDPQFNCGENLIAHLKAKGKVPHEISNGNTVYHRFVGNRFHIFFLDSGLLYHYTNSVQEFFSLVCPPQNVVQQAIMNALKLECLQVTLRALGIIGKCVTGPWMRLLGQNKTILEMNGFYAEAQGKLLMWSNNAHSLLSLHPPSVFESVPVKQDVVLESLLTPTSLNEITVKLLANFCGAILVLIERQLCSQLPGGIFWKAGDDIEQQAKSCSATNISGERNFARADQVLYHAKNASAGHVESKVMFRANNTVKWLTERDVNDKKHHIHQAIKGARAISKEEKVRKAELSKQIRERIKLARHKQQSKDDSDRGKVEQWFMLVYSHGGVWLTPQDVKENTNNLLKTKAKLLLKAQINIRIKVLKCVPDKENKVLLSKATVTDLQRYMVSLLSIEVPEEAHDMIDIIASPESLVGMLFVHQWIVDDQRLSFDGNIVEYSKASGMFTILYEEEIDPTYMSPGELITDVVRGDLELCQA